MLWRSPAGITTAIPASKMLTLLYNSDATGFDLTWQCPEIALVKSTEVQDDLPPLLWGWLAGLRKSQKYDRIAIETIGTGLEPQTLWAAQQYCYIKEGEVVRQCVMPEGSVAVVLYQAGGLPK